MDGHTRAWRVSRGTCPRRTTTTTDDDDDLVVVLVFGFDARRVARPSTHRRSKNRPRTGRWTAAWLEDVAGTEGKLGKVASHVATVRRVSTRGCPDTRREFQDGQFLFFFFFSFFIHLPNNDTSCSLHARPHAEVVEKEKEVEKKGGRPT